jgi:hypothetical protein
MALTVTVTEFKPVDRNSLKGFATVRIAELQLSIADVAVHQRDGTRWAALPSKPYIKDGTLVIGEKGKPTYLQVFTWDSRPVADAFSSAVWLALDNFREARAA